EMSSREARSLRVALSVGDVTLVNKGYFGIPTGRDKTNVLRFRARASADFHGHCGVECISLGGGPHVVPVEGLSPTWKQFELKLPSLDSVLSSWPLIIGLSGTGTVWLSGFSLMPELTWKDRPNGLRTDLAEKLDEMHPSFVRFPGGCFVEG